MIPTENFGVLVESKDQAYEIKEWFRDNNLPYNWNFDSIGYVYCLIDNNKRIDIIRLSRMNELYSNYKIYTLEEIQALENELIEEISYSVFN